MPLVLPPTSIAGAAGGADARIVEEIEAALRVLTRERDEVEHVTGVLRALADETAWESPAARRFHAQAETLRAETAAIAERLDGLRRELAPVRVAALAAAAAVAVGGRP